MRVGGMRQLSRPMVPAGLAPVGEDDAVAMRLSRTISAMLASFPTSCLSHLAAPPRLIFLSLTVDDSQVLS